jgi:hypothetical protein
MDQSINCPFCASVYEDAPLNYLIDFTFVNGVRGESLSQLIGVNAAGDTIFRYQYPSLPGCLVAFNSIPIHPQNTKFPVGLKLSIFRRAGRYRAVTMF